MQAALSAWIRPALLACLTLLVACADESGELAKTQVTLRVRPDAEVSAAISHLRLRVYRSVKSGWNLISEKSVDTAGVRWPLDVPILPSSGALNALFEVRVDGSAGPILLTQTRVITGFAAGSLRLLPVELHICPPLAATFVCAPDSCFGEACKHCGASGQCEPVPVLAADKLPIYEPTRAPEDIPSERDAGASSGPEAGVDAAWSSDAMPSPGATPDAGAGCGANCDAGRDSGAVALPCNGSCPAAQPVCEPTLQSCVPCTDDKHCPVDKQHCDKNACVVCARDEHCTNPSAKYCVQNRCAACRSPSDCPVATNRCVEGTCTSACTTSAECPQQAVCDPVMHVCTCSSIGLTCDGGALVERDSCGKTLAVKSGCCGRGCTGNACNAPEPRASRGCDRGNLYYLDSCGIPTELIQDCCGEGCIKGACQPPLAQARRVCFNGDAYHEDSCGRRGALAQSCCGRGCSDDGVCSPVNTQASWTCLQGDSYWVDSCGMQAGLREACMGRGCSGGSCNP